MTPAWTISLGLLVFLLKNVTGGSFGIPDFLEIGSCASLKEKPNLNIARYSGIWFTSLAVPNDYTYVVDCTSTNYTWTGDIMSVVDKGLSLDKKKVFQNSIMSRNREDEGEEKGFTVKSKGMPDAPYLIADTDYEHYACVYSCMSFMGFRAEFAWTLTRTPTSEESLYVYQCQELFTRHGVDHTKMVATHHGDDCPYMEKMEAIKAYNAHILAQTNALLVDQAPSHSFPEERPRQAVINVADTQETQQLFHDIIINEKQLLEEVIEIKREEEAILRHIKAEDRRDRTARLHAERRRGHNNDYDYSAGPSAADSSIGLLSCLLGVVLALSASHT